MTKWSQQKDKKIMFYALNFKSRDICWFSFHLFVWWNRRQCGYNHWNCIIFRFRPKLLSCPGILGSVDLLQSKIFKPVRLSYFRNINKERFALLKIWNIFVICRTCYSAFIPSFDFFFVYSIFRCSCNNRAKASLEF